MSTPQHLIFHHCLCCAVAILAGLLVLHLDASPSIAIILRSTNGHSLTSSQASPLVARLPVSNLHPRLLANPLHQPEVSRSPTDTSQEPSPSVRFVATKSPLSSSSASFPSNASSVKSHRTSSPTSASSHPLSVLFRSPLRHT